jgi:UDP-2,3-diacylglucosamine pyrophosphatase LpxH
MKYRTLFISDVHLGAKHSNPRLLLDFMHQHTFEHIVIVGDLIDFIALQKKNHWTKECNIVIQKLLRASRKGTKVVYIVGNHDYPLRFLYGDNLGDILILEEYIHKLADNREVYITHGDKYDGFLRESTFAYWIGTHFYDLSLTLTKIIRRFNKNFSLSYYLKRKVKNVIQFINKYEELVDVEREKWGCDIVLTGHIHQPMLKSGYVNCGDFVENNTLVVEHENGKLELIRLKNWSNDKIIS